MGHEVFEGHVAESSLQLFELAICLLNKLRVQSLVALECLQFVSWITG